MHRPILIIGLAILGAVSVAPAAGPLKLAKGERLVLVGNGLGSRMMRFGHFETEVQRRHAQHGITIRNMCDEGNTPGFRPHSGRGNPFAFAGAEKYYKLSTPKDRWGSGHAGNGFFETPDQWLARLKPDVMVAFFGFNESFGGPEKVDLFKAELSEFVTHMLSQKYNGKAPPRLALVSPIAFQDLSAEYDTPDGKRENVNLALYTKAMGEVAAKHGVAFVDLFAITKAWFDADGTELTRDGALLTEQGYAKLAPVLAEALFGKAAAAGDAEKVLAAVREKNWVWLKHFKIPNGVHVYGRRHRPHGPANYPHELKKLEEMTAVRDQAIWGVLAGEAFDLAAADAKTYALPNYGEKGKINYLKGADALASFTVPEGYKIDLFASEQEFEYLANPCQLAFDNRGRLWFSTMPAYPHYEPGAPRPNDKLIILEDTDGDGKADKETVFADGLHLPLGFEFAPEGVYVSQGIDLVLLKDTDGDDRADLREIVFSGFDDHDTHHAISGFCADPSGAILMGEGTFLHSNIETAYGPVRSSNGGFFRYNPQRRKLDRLCRLSLPNPWGIAFDEWGQDFFLDTSDPNLRWMLPGSVKVAYGEFAPNPRNLLERGQMVRPTAGLEFVSSRHFPDEVQGDVLLCNCIGFQGIKQHQMIDEGTGFKSAFRQNLLTSTDRNFRPVDLEFAPDGSLYVVDWHNVRIGHMQHPARDPNRDHEHGRIYRITYPSRPLVKPAIVAGAPIPALFDNLKLPEYRTRYRSRRELRGRDPEQVLAALKKWTATLDASDSNYEHQLLEGLWVSWGLNRIDDPLLRKLLAAKDPRARSAAVRVLRYTGHQVDEQAELLAKAAGDAHGRVRLEVIAAASWLDREVGLPIVGSAIDAGDDWLRPVRETAVRSLKGQPIGSSRREEIKTELTGADRDLYMTGAEVYRRDGHCGTCHQQDGNGLPAAQFPPLAGSEWVTGSEERLIKLSLRGLIGPIEVKGVTYPGTAPMTPFHFLSDQELAAVLTYVRNSFGNKSTAVSPDKVKQVREATKGKAGFYTPDELLQQHPN